MFECSGCCVIVYGVCVYVFLYCMCVVCLNDASLCYLRVCLCGVCGVFGCCLCV